MVEYLNSLSPIIAVLSFCVVIGVFLTAQISLFLAIVISQTKPLREDLKEVKIALTNHITDTNKKIDSLKKEVADLKISQNALSAGQKALESDVAVLKTGQKALSAGQKTLESSQKEINGKLDQLLSQSA